MSIERKLKPEDYSRLLDAPSPLIMAYIAHAYGHRMADDIAYGVVHDEKPAGVIWPQF